MLIFEIDTPSGLATNMRDMISAILGSSVPVVGDIAPPCQSGPALPDASAG